MARGDHQPSEEEPERPARSQDEFRQACETTVAVVSALSRQACDNAAKAVQAARGACVAAIRVCRELYESEIA